MEIQRLHTQRPLIQDAQRTVAPPRAGPSAPARVLVLTPRSGELVTVGHPFLIQWATSCLAGLVLHHLQLSTDGGTTYAWDLAPLLEGKDQYYLWIPPGDVVTETAQIRVRAIGWGEAVSDGLFRIQHADRYRTVFPDGTHSSLVVAGSGAEVGRR